MALSSNMLADLQKIFCEARRLHPLSGQAVQVGKERPAQYGLIGGRRHPRVAAQPGQGLIPGGLLGIVLLVVLILALTGRV